MRSYAGSVGPRRAIKAGAWLLVALALASAGGCGRSEPAPPAAAGAVAGSAPHSGGPALGLTEDNANLLWSPFGPPRPGGASFEIARRELTALHPTYLRLLVDWAALQPDPRRPPRLETRVSGCARQVGPCAAYAGIRDELAAIASQQRAAGTGANVAFQVVVDIFNTPPWAAPPPSGCQRPGASASSQGPSRSALGAYRALIRSLLALAQREGVSIDWWAPWNEPNHPLFMSPQRASCAPGSPPVAPALYAELVRAMSAELHAEGGGRHLLLGELNGFESGSPDRTSVSEFVAALPRDVVCSSDVWSIHAYSSHGSFAHADPVASLEQALNARGGCAQGARIWVTETGAGAFNLGSPRTALAAEEQAGCRAMADQLIRWSRDARVGAVFQYTFREDPVYRVGLVGSALDRLNPTYRLWREWSRSKAAGEMSPAPATCAGAAPR
jgi:hypothetical protein